jgi:serine/threonine-protein kinase HSL1 (negative regulator of Swe1 kinase)
MDHSYHGRPPTRRRALAESSTRANENSRVRNRGDKQSRDQISALSPKSLPHNECIVPNGTLEVRHDQQTTLENKRLSAVTAHEARPHCPKRDSEVSNASTNASNTNGRRKTSIGPWYGAAKIISKATAEKVRALSLANLVQSAEQDVTLEPSSKVIPFGLEREICIMKLLDHPNIVRLYDIWENRNEL